MTKQLKTKKGFTIIEVVLVLAIAGLIFLMVFIALPALQRSQRDTQRSNDIQRFVAAINNFKSNNRGNIPGSAKAGDMNATSVQGHSVKLSQTLAAGTWGYFYDNYLLVGSAGQTDSFADPDGAAYGLQVVVCSTTTTGDGGQSVTNGTSSTGQTLCGQQRNTVSFDSQSEGSNGTAPSGDADVAANSDDASATKGHYLLLVLKATCESEQVVSASGARSIAVVYKREGGGTICMAA